MFFIQDDSTSASGLREKKTLNETTLGMFILTVVSMHGMRPARTTVLVSHAASLPHRPCWHRVMADALLTVILIFFSWKCSIWCYLSIVFVWYQAINSAIRSSFHPKLFLQLNEISARIPVIHLRESANSESTSFRSTAPA